MNNQITILLLEDEIKLAYTLSRALEKSFGKTPQIKICSTAEAALQILHIYHVDLLITDWRLPGMSGIELVAKARKLYPQLPVIFMTAFGSEEVEHEVFQISDVYINKPFEIPDFIQIVYQVLAVHQIVAPHTLPMETTEANKVSKKILILEKNDSLLLLFRKAFQRVGFLVYGALTLQEAEQFLSREHFDVFICDVVLGNGFGLNLLQKWSKALSESHTKIFVMSGDPMYSLINEELEANFFFRKPVEIPAMVSVANSLVSY